MSAAVWIEAASMYRQHKALPCKPTNVDSKFYDLAMKWPFLSTQVSNANAPDVTKSPRCHVISDYSSSKKLRKPLATATPSCSISALAIDSLYISSLKMPCLCLFVMISVMMGPVNSG
jgi:hypothetical protein